jgi:putative transposase
VNTILEVVDKAPIRNVCSAVGLPRATFYRLRRPRLAPAARPKPRRALDAAEESAVVSALHDERFVDLAPREIHAILLDEGRYLCSPRTMYRILAKRAELRERRDQLQHPVYEKPELLATKPDQVWTWDITKLRGPAKWTYFNLYVMLDIFSRYVVAWMVAHRESAVLAERLIRAAAEKQGIQPGELTIHADRGSPMKAKSVAQLYDDLGVVQSHSRPHVSNDNPYSESTFKTLKYDPEFPDRFGSIQDARARCVAFFAWYNREHRHSGIGFLTPEVVHYGRADAVVEGRRSVLNAAYAARPDRFVNKPPSPPAAPVAAWINPPKEEPEPMPAAQ